MRCVLAYRARAALTSAPLLQSVNVGWPIGFEAFDQGDHGSTMFTDASRSAHGRHSVRLVTPTAERGLFVNAVEVMHCAAEDFEQVLPKCQPGLVGELSVMVVSLGNHSSIGPWHQAGEAAPS